MKVLKRNEIPPPWWVEKTLVCMFCQSIFKLEVGDEIAITTTQSLPFDIKVRCPVCDKENVYDENEWK